MITQHPSVQEMIDFGWHCKTISREEVRGLSIPLIDKAAALKEVVTFLQAIDESLRSASIAPMELPLT
jgi:hypothetical protein